MNNRNKTSLEVFFYIGGLLLMILGVAISVKSDLGVSPISSIPYTLTCVTGIDLGIATILFTIFTLLLQIILLRKDFKIINLLQLPVGIMFGLFLTFCCSLVNYLPEPSNMAIKLIMMLISTIMIAMGVFLYVATGYLPLSPEGAMLAISKVTKAPFPNIKLISDITMVAVSCQTCFIMLKSFGSVGIGTVASAVLVGTEVKLLTRFFGKQRDMLLGINAISKKQDEQKDGSEIFS